MDTVAPYVITCTAKRDTETGDASGNVYATAPPQKWEGLTFHKHYYKATSLERLKAESQPGQETKERVLLIADNPPPYQAALNDKITITASNNPGEVGQVLLVVGVRPYAYTFQLDTLVWI